MPMIAGVETEQGICVIRWVGRKGLSVKALLYCGNEANVADGVVQVPSNILKDGQVAAISSRGKMLKCCPGCKALLPDG